MSENLNPVDEGLQKEVISYAKFKASHGSELEKQTFSNVANFIPGTRSVFPGFGIGTKQGELIGTQLFPTIVAAPEGTEIASFPTFGKEGFYSGENDIVAVNGGRKSADFAVTWTTATLDAHAMDAPVDIRLANALASSGIDAAAQALEVARGQVEARKEKAIADLLVTTGTYSTDATLYQSCSTTTLWDHASATPITTVFAAMETVRSVSGAYPNTMWLSPKAWASLRNNAQIRNFLRGTGMAAGVPATLDAVAAIFSLNFVVGTALNTATVNGALADTYGTSAGLLIVGNDNMHTQKFGATFTAAGSPKVMPPYLDRSKGVEGSNIYSYVDYYKPFVTMSQAGFLFLNAGTAS